MKKVLVIEVDVTTNSNSWILALQKIDYEMDDGIIKHVLVKQTPNDNIVSVPSYRNLPFVISYKEEDRE